MYLMLAQVERVYLVCLLPLTLLRTGCEHEALRSTLLRDDGVCCFHIEPFVLPNDISTPNVRADSLS